MIYDQFERALMVVGDKVLKVTGGHKTLDDYEILESNITSELVVRPRPEEPKSNMETRTSLNNMTKQMICELAAERYGVDLTLRTEKKELITRYLELQDQEG